MTDPKITTEQAQVLGEIAALAERYDLAIECTVRGKDWTSRLKRGRVEDAT